MTPKFDWNAMADATPEPAQGPTKPGKFDWNAYPDDEPKKKKASEGAAQAGLEHFGNAASLGYLPQLQALAAQLTPDAGADVDAKLKEQGFKIKQDKRTYVSERDANSKRLEKQAEEHPYASGAGSVGGALATAIASSGLLPIKAASRLGRVAQAARSGAALGAVANPGDQEGEVADGIQAGDRIRNAATGAAFGSLGQGAIEGASKMARGVTNLPASLRSKAEERAFKASGAMLKDYRRAAGQDRINAIGRYMLDKGLIKPGMSVEEIAVAAEKLQGQHGEAIGKILNSLDEAKAAAPSREALAQAIEEQASPLKELNTARPTYKALQNVAQDIRKIGKDPGSFQSAQGIKKFIDEQVKAAGGWGALAPTEKNLALRRTYSLVSDQIEESAGKGAKEIGDEALLKRFVDNKAGFGNAKELSTIAKDQALRQNANRYFSPSDYFSGGMGALVGAASGDDVESKLKGAALGASLGLLNKGARKYGTPLVSHTLDRVGTGLAKTPLSALGEMAAPTLSAIERSPTAVANAVRMLSKPQLEAVLQKVADSEQSRKVASELKAPKQGEVMDGYVFIGGKKSDPKDPLNNPANPKAWKKVR